MKVCVSWKNGAAAGLGSEREKKTHHDVPVSGLGGRRGGSTRWMNAGQGQFNPVVLRRGAEFSGVSRFCGRGWAMGLTATAAAAAAAINFEHDAERVDNGSGRLRIGGAAASDLLRTHTLREAQGLRQRPALGPIKWLVRREFGSCCCWLQRVGFFLRKHPPSKRKSR